jgi:ribonuclease HI
MEQLKTLLLHLAAGGGFGDAWRRAGYSSREEAEAALRTLAESLPTDGGGVGAGRHENATGVQALVVHVDGAARGNPGPAAVAAIAYLPGGEPLTSRSRVIGTATNNVAEYRALLEGIQLARDLGAGEVTFKLDSELVVKQLTGEYRIKNSRLRTLAGEVESACTHFMRCTFEYISRDGNREADRLANEALDGTPEP